MNKTTLKAAAHLRSPFRQDLFLDIQPVLPYMVTERVFLWF